MKYLLAIMILCISGVAISDSYQVYKWVDENGQVHFGDEPSEISDVEKVTVEVNVTSYERVTIDPDISDDDVGSGQSGKVVMYSTSWCGYCKKARQYFRANAIPFTEHDIEKDKSAKKKYDALGGRGVPLILVGKKRMSGFSESSFNRIYN